MMSVIIFPRDKTKPRNVQKSNNIGKFEVKKRVQYENEVVKWITKVERMPISYGDRFIPRRQITKIFNNLSIQYDESENDIFSVKSKPFYWRQHNYRINVSMQLNANVNEKLLNFHDQITKDACNRTFNQNPTKINYKMAHQSAEELDWSCRPRSKPLAYSESTHDMPGFDGYDYGINIVDWSRDGQIAAGFDSSLVLWTPPTKSDESNPVAFELRHLEALKFNPSGKLLALGVKGLASSLLQICQLRGTKLIAKGVSRFPKQMANESISSIEWASTGKFIICGMTTGTIYVSSYPEMELQQRYDGHKKAIKNIKYSIHDTFIAINDIDGNLTILRNKLKFEKYYEQKNVHCFAWHPWFETHLMIGCKSPASIHLLDLKTKTTIAHYRRTDTQYSLCAISINPLSAELVASFSHQVNGITRSDILVMASMNRIVDNISAHQDAVNFILWNPNGTRVATIGKDESLNIWHFFGKSQKKTDELKTIQENKKITTCSKLNLNNSHMQLR